MANFATAADINRPTPRPAEGVAAYRPVQLPLDQGEAAQAQYDQGRQMQELAVAADKFGATMDETAAQDALNKLRQKRLEMTMDPETGFTRLKGDQVRGTGPGGQPWRKELDDNFKRASDDIGANLMLSPRAYGLYQKAASREALGFNTDLVKHFADQSEKYEAAVYKDTQTSVLADAVRVSDDPAKIGVLADRAAGAADNRARQTGMPSQALSARSNVLRVAVETLLPTNPRQALAYYDSIKGQLDGPDTVALAGKLKATTTDLNGENAANAALVNLGMTPLATESGVGASVDNNIGNIVQSKFSWAGGKGAPKGAFETFVTPEHGTAAAYMNIRAKAQANGGTVSFYDLIAGNAKFDGWAAKDNGKDPMLKGNDPQSYAAFLSKAVGLKPTDAVPLGDDEKMAAVLKAMNQLEKGKQTVSDASFLGGIKLARGEAPNPMPRDDSQPQAFKGDVVAGYQKAAADVAARTDLTPTEKAKALALITQQRTQVEGLRAATVKSLDDYSQTALTTAMLDPTNYKDGTAADIAQRYDALGEGAKATRFRVLAAMEGALKTFSTTASEGQKALLGNVLEGLPKQIAEGLKSGDAKTQAQARLRAGDLVSQAKESFGKGVSPEGLSASLKEAAGIYAALGDDEHVRQVQSFYESALTAHSANQQPTAAAQQTLTDLKGLADQSGATAQTLQAFGMMKEVHDRQQTELQKDSFSAGSRIYTKEVGQVPAIDWTKPENVWQALDIRSNQARKIKELSGKEAVPFSNEEVDQLKLVLNAGPPEQQKNLLKTLGRSLPADMMNAMALKLSGKSGDGDDVSHMYASALARYGEGDPAADAVADKILMGAQIMKNGGEAGRKPASTSDAWQAELQSKVGNALALHMTNKVPAEIAAAVKAHYVAAMWSAGKQGEKTDTGQLDKSIDAVTGGIITYRGQQMFAPGPNTTSYSVDAALRSLTSADIPADLRTQEGDQITAEAIKNNGRLLSAGAGVYAVRIPDPRAGGDLRPILDPRTGKAFVLDLRPLLDRAKDRPPVDNNPMGSGVAIP